MKVGLMIRRHHVPVMHILLLSKSCLKSLVFTDLSDSPRVTPAPPGGVARGREGRNGTQKGPALGRLPAHSAEGRRASVLVEERIHNAVLPRLGTRVSPTNLLGENVGATAIDWDLQRRAMRAVSSNEKAAFVRALGVDEVLSTRNRISQPRLCDGPKARASISRSTPSAGKPLSKHFPPFAVTGT